MRLRLSDLPIGPVQHPHLRRRNRGCKDMDKHNEDAFDANTVEIDKIERQPVIFSLTGWKPISLIDRAILTRNKQ